MPNCRLERCSDGQTRSIQLYFDVEKSLALPTADLSLLILLKIKWLTNFLQQENRILFLRNNAVHAGESRLGNAAR